MNKLSNEKPFIKDDDSKWLEEHGFKKSEKFGSDTIAIYSNFSHENCFFVMGYCDKFKWDCTCSTRFPYDHDAKSNIIFKSGFHENACDAFENVFKLAKDEIAKMNNALNEMQ